MPAVSIITPAWNAAAYIRETLDSIRAQTFDDWELVVVDDGSTDDTVRILRSYATRDARIRILHQANAGPSAARNHAMRHACGAVFAFLDSDDAWEPTFLRAQLQVLRDHLDTDLVTATAIQRGGPFDGEPTSPPQAGYPELPLEAMLLDETSVFIMTVFHRHVFDTIGGFDESQWTSEDYDFWLRAAQAGFRFRRNPIPLARYRVRGESLSHNRARMLEGILHSYRKARLRAPAGDAAIPVIHAQIARFDAQRRLEEAKLALERGEYAVAADHLDRLSADGAGRLVAVTAWLARYLPPAAALVYRLRRYRPRKPAAAAAAGTLMSPSAPMRHTSQP